MKTSVALFATAALAKVATKERLLSETEYWAEWSHFLTEVVDGAERYMNKYEHDERFEIFKDNVDKIHRHNEEGHSWTMGVTPFADMTEEEFGAYVKKSGKMTLKAEEKRNVVLLPTDNLADSVDWTKNNAVTPVKNQGQCGSCWSFSTTGALEGAYAVKSGTLLSLSEEQLVDCSRLNNGCNGGSMDLAFMYTERHPLETESDYPYVAGGGTATSCSYDSSKGKVGATGYNDVSTNSVDQLKAAIAKGPVSVAIEADKSAFQLYNGGVMDSDECGTQLDHGVLAVGYGTDNGKDYYIVKNSWGDSWGEAGYIRLGVESGAGICGIQSMPSYPTV